MSLSVAAMPRGPTPERASDEASTYEEGVAAAKAGDCETALPLFERAVAAAPKDADALNMLAYCQRKAGRLDEAFLNYRRALAIRPKFPAAREYLGEAHLQAALAEVEILRSYGGSARQELAGLVAALQRAAEIAGKETSGSAGPPAW